MTYPVHQNSYTVSTGSASPLSPIFVARDPTSSDVAYPLQQRWINKDTQGIWVLERFTSSGAVVQAVWRAIAPIVLSASDPASSDYLYPLGQTWLNTALSKYWVLVAVSGTTATWDVLASGATAGILTINTIPPTVAGNFTVSAGAGVSVTAGANAITIAATGGGLTWQAIGASQTLVINNGYFCTAGAGLSLALPAVSSVGDPIAIVLDGSTSWTITQPNAATRIRIGNTQTSLGVGGSLASSAVGDTVYLICETANARWAVASMIGNITVV